MPVVDGAELRRRMRRQPELDSVPIVILTGNPDAKRSAEFGGVHVVIKPFEPSELVRILKGFD